VYHVQIKIAIDFNGGFTKEYYFNYRDYFWDVY